MKKYVLQAGLVVGLLIAFTYAAMSWNSSSNDSTSEEQGLEDAQAHKINPTNENGGAVGQQASPPTFEKSSINNEVTTKSLKFQTTVLKGFYKAKNPVGALMDYLEKAGQNPVITRDFNDVTGEMVIIRTNNPAPGTRYFHTQAFKDENGVQFIQHMSFEFKAGTQSMNSAKSIAQEIFQVGKPGMERADFMEWQLPDGYTLWAKQLTAEDIKDMAEDEFNAYSPSDVGTVRIAIEQNPHEGH